MIARGRIRDIFERALDSDIYFSFKGSKVTMIAATWTAIAVFSAVFAPLLAPQNPFDPAAIDDAYDFDRDTMVIATDQIIARHNQTGPFAYPELVHTLSRGRNNFVPIPFNKSCKIVLDKGWGAYYQITYTQLPKGTTVPSFRGEFNARERAALYIENADQLF